MELNHFFSTKLFLIWQWLFYSNWKLPLCWEKWTHRPGWRASLCGSLHQCLLLLPRSLQRKQQHLMVIFLQFLIWLLMSTTLNDQFLSGILGWFWSEVILLWLSSVSPLFCICVTSSSMFIFPSTGPVEELSKTKRVRIAEEVILEDESKPKKKKKDGRK